MFRRFSTNFAVFSIVLDAILVMAAFQTASLVRPMLNVFTFAKSLPTDLDVPIFLFPIFAAIWVLVLVLFAVYDGRRNLRVANEFTALTTGIATAALTSSGVLYFSFRDVSRLLFILFVIIAYSLLLAWRIAHRIIRRKLGYSSTKRKMLIIGAGEIGKTFRNLIENQNDPGIEFLGYLDDEKKNGEVIGQLGEARKLVTERSVEDVIFALPGKAHKKANALISEIFDLPVRVWVIPDYFSAVLFRANFEEYAGIPMLNLRAPALNEYQRMVKRAFDLAVTAIILVPSLCLMGIVALAVRFDSPGDIFFRQKRVGENGRIFQMLKFRSMMEISSEGGISSDNSKDLLGSNNKLPNDPRVTPVGTIIRRTSLDELPQLFNVLKGDMSLVGPRPELPHLVEQYEPWQRTRFAVPPGMTGWWQITGRGEKLMHLNTKDDLYYVQNYSLALDINIVLRTIWVVIRGRGAF